MYVIFSLFLDIYAYTHVKLNSLFLGSSTVIGDAEAIMEGEASEEKKGGENPGALENDDDEGVKGGGKSSRVRIADGDEEIVRDEFEKDSKENIDETEKKEKKKAKANKNSTYRRMLEEEERQQGKKVYMHTCKYVYVCI